MKRLLKIFAAGIAAVIAAVTMTVPCFAMLHSDVGDYREIKLWDMPGLARDSFPLKGYGYVVKNTTVKEGTCLVVPEEDTLIVMNGTKLTVKGALHVIGGLYVEKGALIDVQGELCIDGSAVNAGEIRGGLKTYKRGELYCTPSGILKSKTPEPEKASAKPLTAVETKQKYGTLTGKRIITDEKELAALLPDTADFITRQYLAPEDEISCATVFFDDGTSLPIRRSGDKVYMIFTVDVRQPRQAGDTPEIDEEYDYIPEVVSYTVSKSGKIKITDNGGAAPAKYLKKLDKLKFMEHAGTWYGNPAAKLYEAGGGYILWTQPKRVDNYTSKKVYEAFLYKKKA